MKTMTATKKNVIYVLFLVVTTIAIGCEKQAIISMREDMSLMHVPFCVKNYQSTMHNTKVEGPNINIGDRVISYSVLESLPNKDQEILSKIVNPSQSDSCMGFSSARLSESHVKKIQKIANSKHGGEFKKAIDGMRVESLKFKNSCIESENIERCGMALGCTAASAGTCIAIEGACTPVVGCFFVPAVCMAFFAPITVASCVNWMGHLYCSEKKIWKFQLSEKDHEQDDTAEFN